ncbi:response regulator [Halobacillus seohaensis]|uniref:Response regulator n=1 Tax=Halobacillus seohaensis TaxID=447421 RepID=A0ABW2EPN8_9BACI
MKKYQQRFFNNIIKKINGWRNFSAIKEQEIFTLLHSIKGTAASIELTELSDVADLMLKDLHSDSEKVWDQSVWSKWIQPLILFIEFENEDGLEETTGRIEKSHTTLLILEDDVEFLNFFRENMEDKGYHILVASQEKRALRIFYDEQPDVILIDYYLNNLNGLEAMKLFSKQASSLLTPIMIISGESTNQLAKKVYATEANDFLTKPLNFQVLDAMIQNRLNHGRALKKQITTDKLTKVYNRTYLEELMEVKQREYTREAISFCFTIIDLDDFKYVNDTYGHVVGDQVLVSLTDLLKKLTRAEDAVIRYGGEEFIIFFSGIRSYQAKKRMDDILAHFRLIEHSSGNSTFQISFTAGIAQMSDQVSHVQDLINHADLALYKGKKKGKGNIQIYQPDDEDIFETNSSNHLQISIVDDDPIIRAMLQENLMSSTFGDLEVTITSYESGEKFLAKPKTNGYHVVLLDGVLGDMDGLEVLHKIRKTDQKTAVIMVTGRQKDQDVINALNAGADDYVTKPFSSAEMVARIQRIIERQLGGKHR